MNSFLRTKLLIGEENLNKLIGSHVMVFGVGGVGGYVVESLVRSGVSKISIIDNDTVNITNINRQIIATTDTLDKLKVEVMKDRILSINPNCVVNVYPTFVTEENINDFDFSNVDYIVDAIDTISAKIAIILKAQESNIKIISAMGAGNRLDPTQIKIADINQTKNCPLAKVMRYELRKRGVTHLKCIYSLELPITPNEKIVNEDSGKVVIGSIAYMPSIFGLMISSEVIKDLIN
jgi:tRNA A37 threonylcarbamoyladenosine dehydratase